MPIAVGAQAPDFTLKDQNNQPVRLGEFRGRKAALLVFYPLAFTATCQGEMAEVRDHLADFANEVVQVLTISVDSVFSHKVWAEREGLSFPMLADFWPHGAVASAYGVFDDVRGVANRGTFLVDAGGVIRFAEMVDPGTARDVGAWRAAVGALAA